LCNDDTFTSCKTKGKWAQGALNKDYLFSSTQGTFNLAMFTEADNSTDYCNSLMHEVEHTTKKNSLMVK